MSQLQQLGITFGEDKKAAALFTAMFPDIFLVKYKKPSEYVRICWEKYKELSQLEKNNNINGRIFEYILATLFVREGMYPFYMSAKVAFVPNVVYDLMFYTSERGPICVSAKTSLRERYKQADLEAIALKYVHRKSLTFLLTLEVNEAKGVKAKIKSGEVIGLDDIIVATDSEFDGFINQIKGFQLSEPPTVKVIDSNFLVTAEKVKAVIK